MAPVGGVTGAIELAKEYSNIINGKVILVTGVSPNSIGASFCTAIAAANPGLIILAGRNVSKTQATADYIASQSPGINTKVLELDLGSKKGTRAAAEAVNSWDDVPYIDVLVNNAGIMAHPFALSEDGFEVQFATNHLGHFLFTNLIIDKIMASKSPRIICVTSDGHRLNPIRWTDYNFGVCRGLPWALADRG
jgi:NAD(P)-dependent dehydrogenase (short-subunit alcohol dehydrogenase family)